MRTHIGIAASLALLASCAGGGSPPALVPQASQAAHTAPLRIAAAVTPPPGTTITIPVSGAALPLSSVIERATNCPLSQLVTIVNPFAVPATLTVTSYTRTLKCKPGNGLYGITFIPVSPLPNPLLVNKLGDATIDAYALSFTDAPYSLTIPANSTSEVAFTPEANTNTVTFPVTPGTTENLTSNNPNLPSGLTMLYSNSMGASMFTASCYPAFVNGVLASALAGVPLVGIPSFYCTLEPSNGPSITFGATVTFNIVSPPPDRAIFEPDGTPQGFLCTLGNSCNVTQFTVPTQYQNFIAGNVQDLRSCAPATDGTDCNNVNGDPQGGTQSTVSLSTLPDFAFLVGDDPTYKPGTTMFPVPWSGLFTIALTGPCEIRTVASPSPGDVPPNYTVANFNGSGPNEEFFMRADGQGTCTLTATEDSHYITDDSDPANPQPRSTTVSVTIGP